MTAVMNYIRYNNLPYLENANVSRQAVDNIINGPIRDVFLKHDAYNTFCLYLLHRHHTLAANEAIVKVEGTAHLMDRQAIKDIVSLGNKIVPTTWMVSGGEVLAMEFSVVPAATTTSVPTPHFLADLLPILMLNGCDGLFGIDSIAEGGAWAEITIGNANVLVPNNDTDNYNQDKFIPVAFAFDKVKPMFKVHGKCGQDHRHTSKPK